MIKESPPAAFVQPSPGDSSSGAFDNAAPSGGQHHLHQFSSGEPGQAGAGDVQPVSAAPILAGCTGVARVGICIKCERLYLGGPQIAPLAKRENGVYHCIEFVTTGQRLADTPKESK